MPQVFSLDDERKEVSLTIKNEHGLPVKQYGYRGRAARAETCCLKCGAAAQVSRYSFTFCFSHDPGDEFDPEESEGMVIDWFVSNPFAFQGQATK